MSTDDRDIDSSNPSKNFKVGDFDQSSGFFTPVWESKRRIRSEPPAAPPSSKGGSQRAAPSSRSPAQYRSEGSEPPPAPAAPDNNQASDSASGKSKGAPVPRPRAAAAGKSKARSNPPTRAATPVPPAPASERPSAAPEEPASAPAAALPPEVAAVFNAPADDDSAAPVAAAAAALSEVEPEAQREPRAQGSPSAAARALLEAGPNLPPAAFLDEEPEFRSPRPEVPRPGRTERSPLHYRALRATSAATRVHEQLKAKLQAEAAEIDESRYDLDPETHPNPLHGLEPAEPDPYPLSLMRRMRRTVRLSTPVPDRIRSIISKYDRS